MFGKKVVKQTYVIYCFITSLYRVLLVISDNGSILLKDLRNELVSKLTTMTSENCWLLKAIERLGNLEPELVEGEATPSGTDGK